MKLTLQKIQQTIALTISIILEAAKAKTRVCRNRFIFYILKTRQYITFVYFAGSTMPIEIKTNLSSDYHGLDVQCNASDNNS